VKKQANQLTIGTVVSCFLFRKTPISPLLERICTDNLPLVTQQIKQIIVERKVEHTWCR